jgi:hypothetical protein
LSGSSPLTCLAWEALPVAYATASIALGIMWPHKPHHYVKVGIPSGGIKIYIQLRISIVPSCQNWSVTSKGKYCLRAFENKLLIPTLSLKKQWETHCTKIS